MNKNFFIPTLVFVSFLIFAITFDVPFVSGLLVIVGFGLSVILFEMNYDETEDESWYDLFK